MIFTCLNFTYQYIYNYIDQDQFNTLYDPDFIDKKMRAAKKRATLYTQIRCKR